MIPDTDFPPEPPPPTYSPFQSAVQKEATDWNATWIAVGKLLLAIVVMAGILIDACLLYAVWIGAFNG